MNFIPREQQKYLVAIGAYAAKLGLQAWVVGGAVRDFYLKRLTEDIDCTFNGPQDSVAGFCVKMWGGEKHKFSQFGTFKVQLQEGFHLDLARLRKETYARPGVLPSVAFTTSVKEDLFRRDFTVNAWALSLLPNSFGKSVDPYGAQQDIDKGLIRVLHDKSFLDDPTRMFRAVRFAGRFGWHLAPRTEQLLKQAVRGEYPLLISRDRFSRELIKILEEENIKPIFEQLDYYRLLPFIWHGITFHSALLRTQDAYMRLGILVLSLGERGANFLHSLCLPASIFDDILGAWTVQESCLSPFLPLSPYQRTLLEIMHPKLPPIALEPCLLRGVNLKELGLSARRLSGASLKVRAAQFQGKIKTREEAIKLITD